MIVYQTNRQGYFLWPTKATRDPEESRIAGKDVWTLPGWCVAKKPPAEKAGHLRRMVDGRWIQERIPKPVAARQHGAGFHAVDRQSHYSRCILAMMPEPLRSDRETIAAVNASAACLTEADLCCDMDPERSQRLREQVRDHAYRIGRSQVGRGLVDLKTSLQSLLSTLNSQQGADHGRH